MNKNPKVLIDFFDRTDYDFLSNFHPVPIKWAGKIWPTTEHAYQAAKTHDVKYQERIRKARNPGLAKALGQQHSFKLHRVEMRSDWETVKYDIMLELLRIKFHIPAMRRRLIATGNAKLVEGNTWNDTCWGVCNGVGANN